MAIIFSAGGLERVRPRCVCQSFINHNAVLYKVFVVGESHTLVERPSLKNFPSGPAGEEPHTHTHTHTHTYTYPYTHPHTHPYTYTHAEGSMETCPRFLSPAIVNEMLFHPHMHLVTHVPESFQTASFH